MLESDFIFQIFDLYFAVKEWLRTTSDFFLCVSPFILLIISWEREESISYLRILHL